MLIIVNHETNAGLAALPGQVMIEGSRSGPLQRRLEPHVRAPTSNGWP